MAPKRKRDQGATYSRMDVWARGMIWGMSLMGASRDQICEAVLKRDGTAPTVRAVDDVIARKRAEPEWRGEEVHSGRPKVLTAAQQQRLVDLVFAERGKAKVTVNFCRRRLRFLRKVSRQTVERALCNAGLRWLRRRSKTLVPHLGKLARIKYADWLLSRRQDFLNRFAYTDGTTFYLARGPADEANKKRAALGKHVWRMANGKDGLWDENVGPSLYAKSQGSGTRKWGWH